MLAVLPILRGLLAENGQLPRLRVTSAPPATPGLRLPDEADPVRRIAALRSIVPPGVRQVTIAGIGTINADFISRPGRVANRIALITGAAQGFGYEIACDLASHGAWVALADINVAGVEAAANQINVAQGHHVAIGVGLNVTESASVQAAVATVVTAFGGVDLLIANAGVLKAGSVKTQSPADFDFVTNVNYKGYFLCVQAVAPVMTLQHLACPEAWSDIIQINSKSGLTGSNKNSAYAGSKFGGIGLTQSFALELVADGIKVNAVCPGNFLDGPLWSDPQRGLFVQYLKTGKVPGAKNIADVRKFYESRVPMGRGCTTMDVMKAIYYLMEQQYETGQAIPVTGGQVMLS